LLLRGRAHGLNQLDDFGELFFREFHRDASKHFRSFHRQWYRTTEGE
jgi:hypothetical protein